MAFTEIYVDPSLAADSGSGTIGDPYGDLEYAIEQETFDTTNGTRINIKAGTDEVLAAELGDAMDNTVTTVAWVPTESARLVFQGYTSTAGDGGIGGISGGGSVAILSDAAKSYISFIDLHLHNTGAAGIIAASQMINVIGCEVENTSGRGLDVQNRCTVVNNYFHTITGSYGILGAAVNMISNNYFDVTPSTACIGSGATIQRNIIVVNGTVGSGILINNDASVVENNSIYAAGANTFEGIIVANNIYVQSISNNLIEGFSGTGGKAIEFTGTASTSQFNGNAYYDCESGFDAAGGAEFDSNTGNELLTASPFTSASTGDFSPVDTGNVKEGALPQIIGGGLVA